MRYKFLKCKKPKLKNIIPDNQIIVWITKKGSLWIFYLQQKLIILQKTIKIYTKFQLKKCYIKLIFYL